VSPSNAILHFRTLRPRLIYMIFNRSSNPVRKPPDWWHSNIKDIGYLIGCVLFQIS